MYVYLHCRYDREKQYTGLFGLFQYPQCSPEAGIGQV